MIPGEVETTGQWPDNSIPIKTYPEHLERDISNIIARTSEKIVLPGAETVLIIKDLSILTIELMEYILEKDETKKTN